MTNNDEEVGEDTKLIEYGTIPKKYDGCESVRLFFQNEAEHIGSGYRVVLAKIGYKWVSLYHVYSGASKRLTRQHYDSILQQTEQRIKRNEQHS